MRYGKTVVLEVGGTVMLCAKPSRSNLVIG